MATRTDVFYGMCTFWTGDWDWLRERNEPGSVPHCPFCGSPGFETPRETWFAQARAHEAKGHPGYLAMVEWGEKRCFRGGYAELERAYLDRPR